ncbi:hypothetical protein HF086_015979 [Spodoptera exigua]|uniref:Uncharacterized protein n=1 Tax=Spodoptera exigua TaxID=7107 RepID=A0A922SCR3_SPOEX|nr:hypothetical protein HF086_015979 [Spodoptera exigua]
MSKFTCIILCVVAASLTKVSHAVTEEEKEAFREAMAPIIAECSEEHGLDSKGLYDAETGLGKLKKFVKDEDEFAKFEDIAKKCLKVNDESVSDGEAGCDRAKLVLGCFLEHKVEMPF